MKKLTLLLTFAVLFNIGAEAQRDTLRVVFYNVLKFPGSTGDRADSMRAIFDYLKPDIICLTELNNEEGADSILSKALNHTNNSLYARAPYLNGFDTETIVMYNTLKLSLAVADSISTAGSTAVGSSRYIGYTRLYYRDPFLSVHRDTQYVDVIGMHLTAANDVGPIESRRIQARMLKEWLDVRPHVKYILAGGDLNVYTSNEPGYQILLDTGVMKLYDPIARPGDWNNNALFADTHTQSTRVRAFNGGATGGMDDRFDFILVSDSVLRNGSPLKYINGSYTSVGNTGLLFNDSLTHPPVSNIVPWEVLSALYHVSDHLPVYAEFEVIQRIIVSFRDEAQDQIQIQISPNPATDYVHISDQRMAKTDATFTLSDLQGRVLQTYSKPAGQQQWVMDVSGIPSGVYVLHTFSEGKTSALRLIKR
jgi:endonuclease/exonuclease/phosphatase family metal-dependent hydrolase